MATAAPAPAPATATLALQVLKDVATLDWGTLDTTGMVSSIAEASPDAPAAPIIVDLASLDALEDQFGFTSHTVMTIEELQVMLEHIISNLGDYEVEFDGETLLIGQLSVVDLDASLVGLWSNTMSDGSSISIVGQADLIDDVLSVHHNA